MNRTKLDVDIRLDGQEIPHILWEKFLMLTGHKDKHVKYNILKIYFLNINYSFVSSL